MAFRQSRQSIYPRESPAETYWTSLDNCTISLENTCSHLNNAITTLHQGTHDLPRLAKVVASRRCFELVTESEINQAQRDLSIEIEPQIKELIDRAEGAMESLKRREKFLRGKIEKRAANPLPVSSNANSTITKKDVMALESKLVALRRRKELLGKQVAALEAK